MTDRYGPSVTERMEFMREVQSERAARCTDVLMSLVQKWLGEFYSPELESEIQGELEKWL